MSLFQQPNLGMPQELPDMSVQYPQGRPLPFISPMPQQRGPQPPADMDVMSPQNAPFGAGIPTGGMPPQREEFPSYVGNPLIDKYIHAFIGVA